MPSVPNGELYRHGDSDSTWAHSPLYEELVTLPLLIYVPGVHTEHVPGSVLSHRRDAYGPGPLGQPAPPWVQGRSLLPAIGDSNATGRDFVISTLPFANPGDRVSSVDNVSRPLTAGLVTTVTAGEWSLLYSVEPGMSELYHLPSDPEQNNNLIHHQSEPQESYTAI